MANKNISVYITGDFIRMCDIEKSGQSLTVNRVFTVATPPDSVEDGLILDVDSVAEAIRQAFSENGIKKARITFTVYSRKIATKEIELPYVKQLSKIEEMIASNVEDYFPMGNMQDYITRFTVLETTEAEGRKINRISVAAVQKELVASYQELGKALKMPVATIDYQVNSLYNLMKKQVKQGISLVLQMDYDTTHVTIMNGQSQLFRRAVPYGSDALVQNAAALLALDEENARAVLCDPQLREENLAEEEYGELLHDFSQSVMRVVEFYTTKNPVVIETAKLYGVGADFIGLGDVLGHILGIEIETILKLNGVSVKKAKKKKKNYRKVTTLAPYLPNIGAMLHSLDLKIEENKAKKSGVGFGFLFALVGVAVLASAAYCVMVWYESTLLLAEKEHVEAGMEALRPAEAVYNQYTQMKSHLETLTNYAEGTVNDNEALYSLILALEEIMPENMVIENLQADNGEISMSATGSGKTSVAQFIISLKELPFISDVRVSDTHDADNEQGETISSGFSITFRIHVLAEEIGELLQIGKMAEGGAES